MLLLHISDIHFRRDEIGNPMDPNNHLRNELKRDAEEMCVRLGKAPDAIVVSGDIAFAAHADEYAFALSWLEKLAVACGTTSECIFVIPGNHDVVRSLASRPMVRALHHQIKTSDPLFVDGVLRSILQDSDSSRTLYGPLDQFNLFAGQFFCDISAPMNTIATRSLKLNDGSTLKLMGLNSALVSSQADEPGSLFVDPACLQIPRERGVEYVVLCHHPFSWLSQGEALKGHLNDVARLQLFGHEHTNRIELQRDTIRIAASAAHPDRTEHGWEPGYNLIELQVVNNGAERKLNIEAHVRIWQTNPGQFRAKMDRDKSVWKHDIELDAWAPPPVEPATKELPEAASIYINPAELNSKVAQASGSDPMDNLRSIGVRFFKLTLSQKSEIAGKLGLFEDEDLNQPDFVRFRRVFERARDRDLIDELNSEVNFFTTKKQL